MKNKLAVILLIVFAAGLPGYGFAQELSGLESLYKSKKYFELSDMLAGSGKDTTAGILFYKGIAANRFNQNKLSISYLNVYLNKQQAKAEDKFLTDCYETLADNYIKTYNYQKAHEFYNLLATKFKGSLDSEKVADFANSARLCRIISGAEPQSVKFLNDTKLKTHKDIANLTNIPITINGDSTSFVFDTGANISTVTLSVAEKFGFKIFSDTIAVNAITGKQVSSRLAVAPEIKLGNIIIRNAVFLVFHDSLLSFPQANYFIKGIIGYPVIEALGEITFTKSDSLFIRANPAPKTEQNLCLESLTPLVKAYVNGRPLTFSFDTGARTTVLYQSFFKENEDMIKARAKREETNLGGAGGMKSLASYRLDDFTLTIAGRELTLKDVSVLTNKIDDNSIYLYGNLGQDVIGSFSKMTIDFKSMNLSFE